MEQFGDTKGTQRIDKWLNYSCLFKTRSKATRACDERRIKINGAVAKPATLVQTGDELTIKTPGGKFVNMKILAVVHRNVSAKDARLLYEIEELELSDEAKELMELYSQTITYEKPKYKGRPTKKERRKMERFKDDQFPI